MLWSPSIRTFLINRILADGFRARAPDVFRLFTSNRNESLEFIVHPLRQPIPLRIGLQLLPLDIADVLLFIEIGVLLLFAPELINAGIEDAGFPLGRF
jgi:hypothetical protein